MLTHGANVDCPDVRAGRWTRCLGHPANAQHDVRFESPAEHIRNALSILMNSRANGDLLDEQDAAAIKDRLWAAVHILEAPSNKRLGPNV